MTTTLSPEQQQALEQHPGRPIEVVHPATHEVYVLISENLYQQVRALRADDAFDIRETYAAQSAALAKVWDDPELNLYNDCHGQKNP